MPHAKKSIMTMPTTNGEVPSSKSLARLISLPAVSSGIDMFKSNPMGGKLVSLANQSHESIVAPVLPYASKPYGYVKPYFVSFDSLAEGGLDKVEQTFPIIKEDIGTVKVAITDFAYMPFGKVFEGYRYVTNTYSKEWLKCGGKGLVAGGMAIVTTELAVTSDGLAVLSSMWCRRKDQAREVAAK